MDWQTSRPVRARGLKSTSPLGAAGISPVAPRAGAWVEMMIYTAVENAMTMSRPVRARGLKYEFLGHTDDLHLVAPRAGAWVEMTWGRSARTRPSSRPVRARGSVTPSTRTGPLLSPVSWTGTG